MSFVDEKEASKPGDGTVTFSDSGHNQPFDSCTAVLQQHLVSFKDPKSYFTVEVDSTWRHVYRLSEGIMHIHKWFPYQDTSICFTIVVDGEKYSEEDGTIYEKISWEYSQEYLLDNDTAVWSSSVGEFTEDLSGDHYFTYTNRFQYYSRKSNLLYFIFATDSKEIRSDLNMTIECMFKKSIESFQSIPRF